MARKIARHPFLTVIFVLIFIVTTYMYFSQTSTDDEFFKKNYLAIGNGASVDPNVCHLPIDVSPFDSSIAGYFESLPKQVKCSDSATFQPLTYVDENSGVLKQNGTAHQCEYRWVEKFTTDDYVIQYGPWKKLDSVNGLGLPYLENYIHVKCGSYENVHFWFNGSAAVNKTSGSSVPMSAPSSDTKPSVVFLVIESLSRLNYLRYLNHTQSMLEHHLGNTFYLDGLNKMADNSYPNMVPLLTGKRLYKGELNGTDENYGPYDDWPLIWKNFSQAGYLTALLEDYPKFTLFNYESKGFIRSKPTDFYPRPFWIHLFSDLTAFMMRVFPFDISPCYKDRVPKIDVFLDQIAQIVKQAAVAKKPVFAFTFYIELTHNDFNKAQTIDSHIAKFIENSASQLNDSVLVVMGDHGNRFGDILQTTIGRIEERMPLFAIHVPEKLSIKYPHLKTNLKTNRRRLSTWLDVNQMLHDIIDGNYNAMPTGYPGSHKRAYSPWREEIPVDRTCATALIDDLYCVCDRRMTLDRNDDLALTASATLVEHLNYILSFEAKCKLLVLNETLLAELIFPSGSTAQAKGFRQTIEITISVSPSSAIFRSRLYRTAYDIGWHVGGNQVTRINEYGDQPWCISQRDLKPFCFCPTARVNITEPLAHPTRGANFL